MFVSKSNLLISFSLILHSPPLLVKTIWLVSLYASCPGLRDPYNCQFVYPFTMPTSRTSSHSLIIGRSSHISLSSSLTRSLRRSCAALCIERPIIIWIPSLVFSGKQFTFGFSIMKTSTELSSGIFKISPHLSI